MKNLLKSILTLGLIFGFIISPTTTFASENERITLDKPTLINNETGEVMEAAIKNIRRDSYQSRSSNGSITESYTVDVSIPIGDIRTRDAAGGSITEADCTATLNITYYLRNSGEEINITNISGGWEPQSNYISISNKVASVTDGAIQPLNKVLRENPTSNSFSYDIDWGYVTFYLGSEYSGARGYTEATLSIPGMGGSYNLFLPVCINR